MSELEKKELSKDEIAKALSVANIEIPTEISRLDEFYIYNKVILETENGKFKYSNSVISLFFRELGIPGQETLNCNYRKDFKELFAKNFTIQIQDNNSFFSKAANVMNQAKAKLGSHNDSTSYEEKHELPKSFDDAKELYRKILADNRLEIFKENCDVRRDINVYFTDSFGKNTGVAITKSDEIWIDPPVQANTNFFILVSLKTNTPVIWGSFVKEDKYYLCAKSENVKIGASDTNTNYKIIFANEEFTRFFAKDIKVFSKSLPVVDEVLCIDFGTSNTTAGTWIRTADGVKTEIVSFDDFTKPNTESKFLPTIVYLKDLRREEGRFLFGYEAKKHIIDNDYNPKGNIFYNIKQWITVEDDFRILTGTDEYGEECEKYNLFAKNMIIEYLKYVIINAEIRLKRKCRRLHFSAPVKCKDMFITFLTERFRSWRNEYEILPANESLDEAIAIIYNRISEFKVEFENGRKSPDGELMVIDCGGGTTDAASCFYHFSKTDTGTKIDITTKFENGQTAFGGNDLTYRIFQFLKIRLADYYCEVANNTTTKDILIALEKFHKIDVTTGKVLYNAEEDFFSHIDTCIKLKERFDCYDQLDAKSKDAEWIIPTDFNNKEIVGTGSNIPEFARRNFNYLWQLAEQWKIALYSEDATFAIDFKNKAKMLNSNLENICFYINQNVIEKNSETNKTETRTEIKDLQMIKGIPEISFNREELIALLKPQIYYLLSVMFLKPDGTDRKGEELPKKLHLSGQSCRIGTFQDMLKEFIPGKNLRGGTKLETAEQKKLACVEGCIQYLSDKAYGKVYIDIKADMPSIIYTVAIDRGSGVLDPLLDGGKIFRQAGKTYMPEIIIYKRELNVGWIRLNVLNNLIKGNKANYWKDVEIKAYFPNGHDVENSAELKKEIMRNAPADFDQWEIAKAEKKVLDCLIDRLKYDEAVDKLFIFAIPDKDGFTFTLWQILKYKQKDNDGHNIEKFRIMGHDSLQYQKIEFTTHFDGQNCK